MNRPTRKTVTVYGAPIAPLTPGTPAWDAWKAAIRAALEATCKRQSH
jgi:hypothetical protein